MEIIKGKEVFYTEEDLLEIIESSIESGVVLNILADFQNSLTGSTLGELILGIIINNADYKKLDFDDKDYDVYELTGDHEVILANLEKFDEKSDPKDFPGLEEFVETIVEMDDEVYIQHLIPTIMILLAVTACVVSRSNKEDVFNPSSTLRHYYVDEDRLVCKLI